MCLLSKFLCRFVCALLNVISQCTLSAYTQLIVHAQLWCQSLCGKSWCMEWGACWAVWVCCCHDDHSLDNCAAQKRWLGVLDGVVLLFGKVSSFALHGRPVVTIGLHFVITKNFVISKVFFHQSGQSPKIIRAKGVGLERTDSQTVGEFPRGRRKGRYSTLNCHLKTFHSVSKTLTRLFACYQ